MDPRPPLVTPRHALGDWVRATHDAGQPERRARVRGRIAAVYRIPGDEFVYDIDILPGDAPWIRPPLIVRLERTIERYAPTEEDEVNWCLHRLS